MVYQVETFTRLPSSSFDTFDGGFVLSEFLHEMEELDRAQASPSHSADHSKRRREPDINVEPEAKKIKLSEPLSTSSKSEVSTNPLPRKRRSSSWLRRKQELLALRNESETLGTKLALLEAQQAHSVLEPRPQSLTEGQELWKSVASIARQECQSSQEENIRLKNELQMYARASEMLQTQLIQANLRQQEQHYSKTAFENAVRVGIIMSRRLYLDDSGIFDMLESKVGDRFFELDVIVNAAHQPVLEGAYEHVQVCREDGRDAAATVEFKHTRLLPFGHDTTAKTIWEIIELGGLITDRHFRVAKRSNDVVGMASRFTIPLDPGNCNTVNVDVHAVAKRFTGPVGMVVLVESRSEWSIDHSTASGWKQITEEAGWVAVNEHPQQSEGAKHHACQLQTTMKLRPNASDVDGCGSTSTRQTFTGNIGDVVIPSFREIMSSHHQSVENFLLDSSRAIKA
ncbi:hypothetical protein PC129_g7039 [Phytophthora cactorum]|uniref:Uncharacterized protein n=1 Tax=Phytophthora cactorum TaxID=29920 RepID=A0A329RF31_9STRA|nr:hypothetical protein Pcac1_g1358 [Phytophthora cactorum]KAG2837213.1 hypothetical protein PC111_g4722 [Phytophthora cactorum]KAG2837953.1 hypothetical protein PC112_g4719 [Phytophthora cactorum]KAG2862778.1 hypothetical protein PC113_g5997 [Phytophthora cactorum]KAG2923313.1 hypothetical protein PC114_g4855 [Phytophthora cactorum]